jgi:UDP-3-O-[3-hydroxymyristoyl] glucosamine N-acyltransferase
MKINGINDLENAKLNEISFFNSLKYLELLKKTKSKYIITDVKYKKVLKDYCSPLVVENVLKAVAIVTNLFYPNSLKDTVDFNISEENMKNYKNVQFGKNTMLGKNVKIGKNCIIGHNTIIESNVKIGDNCIIGNNILIKNTILGNNVTILDGSIIGKKGFGFFPGKNKNLRYPHIGMVIIGNNVEIGSNNNIDRGSISNTIIGDNTFLDNQVHIAHNVKIGKNCIITAQVGFAGSSVLGDRVSIGGQAGISGHLKIGNNVQIGGGSGVIKNISDNSKVMGYPAKDIRNFLKENK